MDRTDRAALALAFALAVAACSSSSDDPPSSTTPALSVDAAADAVTPTTPGEDAGGADAAAPASTSFVDPRDGKTYPTMKLGAKTWLARNLDFAIPGSSFCYDNDARNCASDGRLYLWSAAPTACPAGWHLGTDAEWKSLEAALGMASSQLDIEGYDTSRGTNEGTTFKGSARMAGYRSGTTYDALGDRTYFWTASTRGSDVWRRRVVGSEPTIFRFTNPPGNFAISIRCVQD